MQSKAQAAAVSHVRKLAEDKKAKCHTTIAQYLEANSPNEVLDIAIVIEEMKEWVRAYARITVNFHPDRLSKVKGEEKWRTVAEAFLEDNEYKCQFVTGISNGGLTAYPGGDRDKWEERMFGKSYHTGTVEHHERPRYGGLNIFNYLDGACPRFGSCHFRLHKHMLDNATFSYGDSVLEPEEMGVIDAFDPLLSSMIENIATKGFTLGSTLTLNDFLNMIRAKTESTRKTGRSLDNYIEAQIHSNINLATDVEAVVVDPSFRGSVYGDILQKVADKNNFKLEWNDGFMLKSHEIPEAFRGPLMSPLASRILLHFEENKAREEIHTEMLGRAARNVVLETHKWEDWGNSVDSLQHIKYLWHTLVVYGRAYN